MDRELLDFILASLKFLSNDSKLKFVMEMLLIYHLILHSLLPIALEMCNREIFCIVMNEI